MLCDQYLRSDWLYETVARLSEVPGLETEKTVLSQQDLETNIKNLFLILNSKYQNIILDKVSCSTDNKFRIPVKKGPSPHSTLCTANKVSTLNN